MRLNAVHDLFTRPGPFVTVSTEVGRTTEDARQQLDARWTTIRHALEHEDVGGELIDEIGGRLQEPPPVAGPARRTLVAEGGEIVFDDVQAGTTRWPEVVEVGPLPDLTSWLAQGDRQIPFALVVAGREGADIYFHHGVAEPADDEMQVEGEDFGITKVAEGDWKQKKYQQSAESQWKHNAEEVAEELRTLVRTRRPHVVILAGDVRAVSDIETALEGVQVPVLKVDSGGRNPGASDEALWDDVRLVLAEIEARKDQEVTDELLARTGQGTGAARGLGEVLDALVKGQVERLVIDLEATSTMTVDPAEHPGLRLPEGLAGEVPADRVLVAAAAATDAEVSVLPRQQSRGQGVAAILRWDDSE